MRELEEEQILTVSFGSGWDADLLFSPRRLTPASAGVFRFSGLTYFTTGVPAMPPTMTFDEQTKVYHLPLFDQHKTPAEIVAFGEDISDELSIRILYDVPREKLAEGLLLVGDIDKINVVKDDEDEFPDNDWSMTLEEEAEADANIAKLIREWPEIQSRNREANIRAWMPPKLAALRS